MAVHEAFDLFRFPVHLGLGATVVPQPAFEGGLAWYEAYDARHGKDGAEGRLVSAYTFDAPWTSWEMHPLGDELVVCLAGKLIVHQEVNGSVRTVTLEANQALVNPPGVWHTADVHGSATALFVTAGAGTEHRPR
jgi:mannose-6-phosphate isomerase-like protein (cupin superfamily)